MTIAGHDVSGDADWILRGFEIMTTGTPDPFWDDVRRHVTSWLIVIGIGSIGWMAVTLPTQLDRVLANQERLADTVKEHATAIATVEEKVRAIEKEQ